MKRVRYLIIVALTPFAAWCAETSENPDFARYRSIIDRMPFGEPPPNFDPTAAPGSAAAAAAAAAADAEGVMTEEQRTEEEQKLASSVRVSVLNVTPAGRTMVGFTDSSSKPPEHYYLPVGGERDGWSVKDADPATEKVTLAKSGIEVTLKLGEGSTGGKGDKNNKKNVIQRGHPPFRRGGLIGARLGNGPAGRMLAAETGEVPATATPQGAMARLREQRARQLMEQQEAAKREAEAKAEAKAEGERRAAEAKEAAEQAAAEREAQRETLMQIQEELRRQREEKEKQRAAEQSDSTDE